MIRGFLSLCTLVALTILLGLPALLVALLHRRSYAVKRFGRYWARGTLAVMGVRRTYHGLEHLESVLQGGSAVLVANHMSLTDVLLLVEILPVNIRFVAKESLFRVPLFGMLLRAAGYIPIDRTDRNRAIRSLEKAAALIRDGDPVLVFAEGTRSRKGRLQPFKKGAFHLAVQAGVPVIPVAISGTWNIVRPGGFRVRPGEAKVSFAEPVSGVVEQRGDMRALMQTVRRAIASRLAPDEIPPVEWGEQAQAR